jgi:hypothetical protein
MTKITVSFELEGTNAELMDQISKLLHEPISAGLAEIKAKKPKRILTEAQKKIIRDRFAAGRAKAALARGEIVAPTKPSILPKGEKITDAPKLMNGKQLGSGSAKLRVKPGSKPIPQTGHKIEPKLASE